MGSKAPQMDPSAARKPIRKNTPREYDYQFGPLGSVNSVWNPETKKTTSSLTVNPDLSQALTGVYSDLNNYNDLAAKRADEVFSSYYEPFQFDAKRQLDNYFGGLTPSLRRNTMAQNALAAFAEAQARNKGSELYKITQQSRNDLLSELLGRAGAGLDPFRLLFGQAGAAGQQLGNQRLQGGIAQGQTQLSADQANLQAQIAAQQANNQLFGGSLGAVGSLIGSFIPTPRFGR